MLSKSLEKVAKDTEITISHKTIKNNHTRSAGINQVLIDVNGDGCIDAAYEIMSDGSYKLNMHSIGFSTISNTRLYNLKNVTNEIPHKFSSESELIKFFPEFKKRIKFYPKMKHEYYGLGSQSGFDFNVASHAKSVELAKKGGKL